jgi:hypothetical protein
MQHVQFSIVALGIKQKTLRLQGVRVASGKCDIPQVRLRDWAMQCSNNYIRAFTSFKTSFQVGATNDFN